MAAHLERGLVTAIGSSFLLEVDDNHIGAVTSTFLSNLSSVLFLPRKLSFLLNFIAKITVHNCLLLALIPIQYTNDKLKGSYSSCWVLFVLLGT